MASLMEGLITVLEQESIEYEKLLELSIQKTPVIIAGDTVELQKITDEEKSVISVIQKMEKQREISLQDIADVINKDVANLKLKSLIQMLETRPEEQQKLAQVHDKLQKNLNSMVLVNDQNRELLRNSLEMVEFDMNLIQAMKAAPETADYNKGAYNAGNVIGMNRGSFDAKQ